MLHERGVEARTGTGEWAPFGGHVEVTDPSLEEAARRELREELGVEALTMVQVGPPRLYHYEGRAALLVSFRAEIVGEPAIMEADKCRSIRWFNFNELPSLRWTAVDVFIFDLEG